MEGYLKAVSPGYFKAMSLRVLRGRLLDNSDRAGTAPVVVISEGMAKAWFTGRDPIGQTLLIRKLPFGSHGESREVQWRVVGEVSDEFVLDAPKQTASIAYAPPSTRALGRTRVS